MASLDSKSIPKCSWERNGHYCLPAEGGEHPRSPPCTEGNISRPPQRWLRPTAWPAGAISVSCPPLPPGALPSGVCMLKGTDPDPGGRELAMSCR